MFQRVKVTFKVTQGHWYSIPQAACDFLLVFHCNYVSVLYHLRDNIFPKFKAVT